MDIEFAKRILDRNNCNTIPNQLHGYIVTVLDNKVWKSKNGRLFFSTEEEANRIFYQEMRPEIEHQHILDGVSEVNVTRYDWQRFKSIISYNVVLV